MRINFTVIGLLRTGGNRVIFELANRLSARGHNVTITSLSGKTSDIDWFPLKVPVISAPNGEFVETSKIFDFMIRASLSLSRLFGHRRTFELQETHFKKLTDAIPECDISVATHCMTAFPVHRSGKGIPFYYVQHYEPLFFDDPYLKRMAEETYHLPLHIVTVSTWLKDLMKQKYSRDSRVILNGVDRTVFFSRSIAKQTQLGQKAKRIVCIGRDMEWKGLNDLIQAMEIVHKGYSAIELVIVTQDKLTIGKTKFPYRIVGAPTDEDLAREYCSNDVFVSPSWYEGSSLPPLEAMSCGVPVITTSQGPEDYAVDERNALVVNPRRPDEFTKAITRVLTDESLSSKLAAEGIRTAEQLTWGRTTANVEDAFESALNAQ